MPANGWAIGLASVNGAGADGANAVAYLEDLSDDGTKVLLRTVASNLGPKDTNGRIDIYLHDLSADTTSLVARNGAATDAIGATEAVFSPVEQPGLQPRRHQARPRALVVEPQQRRRPVCP